MAKLSTNQMKEYCEKHIDNRNVEPIIRYAFTEQLVDVRFAYIYFRVAEMQSGVKMSYTHIANETGLTLNAIKKYVVNDMVGISEKLVVMVLIYRNLKDLLDIWEHDDYNQALADYINSNSVVFKKDGVEYSVTESKEEADKRKELSKDRCRKIYRELLNEKVRFFSEENIRAKLESSSGGVYFLSVSVEEDKETSTMNVLIQWKDWEKGKEKKFTCQKTRLVHAIIERIHRIIGGWKKAEERFDVYLHTNQEGKVRRALEYLALSNENVLIVLGGK